MTTGINRADNLQPKVEKIFIDISEKDWGPKKRCWGAGDGVLMVFLSIGDAKRNDEKPGAENSVYFWNPRIPRKKRLRRASPRED
ncbi:hypothetical protein [Rhodopirellula halodulae]|nr:hypothetical protein [Rhodopirellula sp. JC737]MCC9657991.1 hypothetical protein [Rhodopirellula sp. JC737]